MPSQHGCQGHEPNLRSGAASAALDARPDRRTIVTDRDNFPTDRYVLEGLARDRDREIAWIDPAAPPNIHLAPLMRDHVLPPARVA